MKLAPFDVKNEHYHIGHLFMDGLRSRPDAICQMDAATGESETNASVLARSIQLARCMRKFGVKPGDVLALGGRNHLDLHIPYYAALLNGMPIAGVDPFFKYNEIRTHFKLCAPKIAFCEKEMLETYETVAEELGLNIKVICFAEGEHSLATFIDEYNDNEDTEEFLPSIFDLDKIYAWLISTGGTTGTVKLAAFKHKVFINKLEQLKAIFSTSNNIRSKTEETVIGLNMSPVQWVSAYFNAIAMPLMGQIKLQTSAPQTTEHIIDIINQYKPVSTFLSPSLATAILKGEKECDFTCFANLVLSGGKIHKDVYRELKKRMRPDAILMEAYGQTENLGPSLMSDRFGPVGNCGKESPSLPVKLVDPKTGNEVTAPHVHGELWTKYASFSEYYNNPEETENSFSDDGWYKTGDILYRDEEGYFYFVERFKMLIKYRSYHIIPPEIEAVIREHPGVFDVSVTSTPHKEDGEHVVACVVKKPGANVTAGEIKELVANKLSDSQRLRGGVVFVDKLPLTSTGKIARGELYKIVLSADRE